MVMPGADTQDYRETVKKGGTPARGTAEYDTESQSMSFAVAYVDHIPTVREVIEGIIKGAEDILSSWEWLKGMERP